MTRMMHLGAIAILLSIQGPPAAALQSSPPSAVAAVKPRPAAIALVQAVTNSIDRNSQIENLLDSFTVEFMKTPAMMEMEEVAPGVGTVFKNTLRPFLISESERLRPLHEAEVASLYSAHLTDAELNQLTAFWRSPLGKKVVTLASQRMTYKSLSTEMVQKVAAGEEDFGAGGINSAKRDAMRAGLGAASQLTITERKAVDAIFRSPAGQKYSALMDERMKIDLKWFSARPSPEVEQQIQVAIASALDAHLAGAKPSAPDKKN